MLAPKLHAKGHTVVLGKVNNEPIAKNMELLAQDHMCLYPKFQYLVDDQN